MEPAIMWQKQDLIAVAYFQGPLCVNKSKQA